MRDGILDIIDLTNEFHMVKFNTYADYEYALIGGLWLIYDHYLTICKWDPKFNTKRVEVERVAVWVRLPELSIRLYDEKFLIFVRNRIKRTLKVDATIVDHSKGKYARLCIKIYLNKELLSKFKGKMYKIEYESLHMIYFFYHKYGHYTDACDVKAKVDELRTIGGEDVGNARVMEQP